MIISFVYPYLDFAARGDELRWSIRSLKNIRGCTVMPVVLGRAPDWFRGPNLRLAENGSRERDVQSKILQACWTDFISERFVVVTDDTVFSKPIDIADVMTARFRGSSEYSAEDIRRISGSSWQNYRRDSLEECLNRGWTTKDTAVHWPWTFEKHKVLTLFSEMDLVNRRYLIEIIYANRFAVQSKSIDGEFAYVRRDGDHAYWDRILRSHQVVNWSDAMFNDPLRAALFNVFPEPSQWEKTGAEAVTLEQLSERIVLSNQSCLHLGEPIRFENSPFTNRPMPVFECKLHGECVLERINTKPHKRCIACKDRVLTNRIVQIDKPPSIKRATNTAAGVLVPSKAEQQAATEELACRHREGIAYTVDAGSRPCVRRPISVWNCSKHGQCSLRLESCLGGKVKPCSTCVDMEPPEPVLVQINEDKNGG